MSVRTSLLHSFVTKYLVLVVQFVSTIILARILSPTDIGIYTVAAVVAGLTQVLRQFGIPQFIVQEKDLNQEKLRAAFTISLALNWFIGAMLYLLTDVIASFYGEQGIAKVLNVLVITFLLSPIASVPIALLRRAMQFQKLMIIEVLSAIAHAGVGVSSAYYGEQYMSLAWASLAGVLTTVLVTWFFKPKEMTFLPGFKGLKRVASYGAIAGGATLIGQISFKVPDLVIGKVLTMHSVGIFGKAMSTIMLFNKVITDGLLPVFLSHFSKSHREGKDLVEAYLYVVSCLTVVSWPFFLFMAINANDIVLLLYGDQWLDAATLIQIMCASMMIYAVTSLVEHVFTAIGKIEEVFRLQVFTAVTRITLVLASVSFGLEAIAIALTLVPLLRMLVVFPKLNAHMAVTFRDHFQLIKTCFYVTSACCFALIGQLVIVDFTSPHYVITLLASSCVYFAVWVGAIFYFNHPIRREVLTAYKTLKRKLNSQSVEPVNERAQS